MKKKKKKKVKQISLIYWDNKSPGCSFLIVLTGCISQPSSHLVTASHSNHPSFFVTLFFWYLSWTKLYPHMVSGSYFNSKSTKWPCYTQKNQIMLCPVLQTLLFLCFPATASFFPEGHADMNATLTANPMRRTFQSPIITKNQTSKVPWPGCFMPFQSPCSMAITATSYLIACANIVC